jgi:DNA replication and repair protein RecF
VLLDGVKRPLTEVVGHINAVVFVPQMVQIIEGGPDERRRYLNLSLAQAVPGYAGQLSEYTQALTQRNALLKQLGERGGDPSQLEFWDESISRTGAGIILRRIEMVQELELLAARIHRELTDGQEILRLNYLPAYDPLPRPEGQIALPLNTSLDRSGLSLEDVGRGFREKLRQMRAEEIRRGVTVPGPHRDELRFLANGIDLGDYGSRGQVRTALLALKLAEIEWIKARTGQWPVLLLDEVLAELDLQRRADLLTALDRCEQALLTTTDLKLFDPAFVQKTEVWDVSAGSVKVRDDIATQH